MGRIDTLANCFTDICDAIRAKTGKTDKITPANITTEITNIPTGGGEPNIFIQEEEPTTKEGLWIQTSNLQVDKIVIDEYLHAGNTWMDHTLIGKVYNSTNSADMSNAVVNGYLYLCGASSINTNMFKFNLTDYSVETLSKPPVPLCGKQTVVVGTDIYYVGARAPYSLDGLNDIIKYDTLTDTYTTEYTFDTKYFGDVTKLVYYNGFIYMFGLTTSDSPNGYTSGKTVKYNIAEKTITDLPYYPKYFMGYTDPILIGDKIWFLFTVDYNSSSTVNATAYRKTRVFDLTIEDYVETNVIFSSNIGSGGSTLPRAILIGDIIFLYTINGIYELPIDELNISETTKTIDLTSLTLHPLPDNIGNNKNQLSTNMLSYDEKNIYISGFTYATDYDVLMFSFTSKEYDNNTLVIRQGISNSSAVLTQLFNMSLHAGRLTYPIFNALHYTTENGLNDKLPLYYGDGTQWIKFKN